MSRLFRYIAVICLLAFVSCNRNETLYGDVTPAPEIAIEGEGFYTAKIGREVVIAPLYDHAEGAQYLWQRDDGEVLGREPVLRWTPTELTTLYLTLTVETSAGRARMDMRIDVLELEVPTISLAVAAEGFRMAAGERLNLQPVVANCSIPTTCRWTVDDVEVATEAAYAFTTTERGRYHLRFATRNEDGEDAVDFDVVVCNASELPFGWSFERTRISTSVGRPLCIGPVDIEHGAGARYTWRLSGAGYSDADPVQEGEEPLLRFTPTVAGSLTATVTVEAENLGEPLQQRIDISVATPEQTLRPTTATSRAAASKVYAYLPAPGQFINENYTATTAEAACAHAEQRLATATPLSLGAFGGSIVVGFDHSIPCGGDYDFAVLGNAFAGSSEPGIVYVMQDENGNGEPDDVWYALRGSESDAPTTDLNYAVTYYRPRGQRSAIAWRDNRGATGTVDYVAAHHTQTTYYPAWVTTDSYTLRGVALAPHNVATGENDWSNGDYAWGYADNFSLIDRVEGNAWNYFRIADAVDDTGTPVRLAYIDFVKVQTAVQAKSGHLGELSTEVAGFKDLHLR